MNRPFFPLRKMIRLAILTAIIFLLAFTPLGYLRIGFLEITFLTIPVLVGACILGPAAGAFLGLVFGLTSFSTCFGTSAFGVMMLEVNPFFAFLVCVPTRVLMGFFSGLLFLLSYNIDPTKKICFLASCLCGSLLNTFFFMSTLMLCFGRAEFIQTLWTQMAPGAGVLIFILSFVGIQGLVEGLVCGTIGATLCKTLFFLKKRGE